MRGMGGEGGRRRVFDGGELRLVLLALIAEHSGGAYAPSPGVVYPTLTLLQDMGLAAEESAEGARKLFAVTEAGRTQLAERAAEVEAAMARLAALADMRGRTDAAPVRRAMQNLKTALHNRLSQAGVDRQAIFDVAGLIDEAAAKIERL